MEYSDSDYEYLSTEEYYDSNNDEIPITIQNVILDGSKYNNLSPDDKLLIDNEFYAKYFNQIEELFDNLKEWGTEDPKKNLIISSLTLDKLYMFLLKSSSVLHTFVEQDVGVSEGK